MTRAATRIREHDYCVIATHVRPEGDALGSLLGLALALEQLGQTVVRLASDVTPRNLRFLPGAERLTMTFPEPPPLAIVVDCDGLARTGPHAARLAAAPNLIDIDHHASGRVFGLALVDPNAAATGELVYDLVRKLGVNITPEIATCLYTALATDTGRFCYANTTPRSVRLSADLIADGANPRRICREVYERRSPAATRLLGAALASLTLEEEGRIALAWLGRGDFARTGANPEDTEGIIDHLRAIDGVRAAALLSETEDQQIRVSLRSDNSVDVSRVALAYGGGGHPAAAGFTLPAPPSGGLPPAAGQVREALAAALSDLAPGPAGNEVCPPPAAQERRSEPSGG